MLESKLLKKFTFIPIGIPEIVDRLYWADTNS